MSCYVVEMEACGRLIEDIEGVAARGSGEFFGQFDPLRFSAGECRGGLPES